MVLPRARALAGCSPSLGAIVSLILMLFSGARHRPKPCRINRSAGCPAPLKAFQAIAWELEPPGDEMA